MPARPRPSLRRPFASSRSRERAADLGGITAGPDGNLWFTEPYANTIGRITTSGVLTEFPVPTAGTPSRIAAGPDGNLWFTDPAGQKIGRITTAGEITEFSVGTNNDPSDIVAGSDGNLWFTEGYAGKIGRITTAGAVTQFSVPGDAWVSEIAAGPDGNLWFTELYSNKIDRITTSGVVTVFSVPGNRTVGGIAAGPDGNLWFTEGLHGVGRITTAGVVSEFPLPAAVAYGGYLAAGSDGNLWFSGGNAIGRITTSGVITAFHLPAEANVGDIAPGPDGNLWFTDNGGGRVGWINPAALAVSPGPTGACVADPTTLCLNEGRFQVSTKWHAPGLGTSGQGIALPLTSNTGSFWFFDPTNIEVVVKVLNGCSINRRAWVFAGGLTNVNVTMTVADTQTGLVETYLSPAGIPFQPIQDTSAFSPCP